MSNRRFRLILLFFIDKLRTLELADFVLAVRALQCRIGAFPETFRMLQQSDFPAQHYNQAGEE